jgi:hypothetical protein
MGKKKTAEKSVQMWLTRASGHVIKREAESISEPLICVLSEQPVGTPQPHRERLAARNLLQKAHPSYAVTGYERTVWFGMHPESKRVVAFCNDDAIEVIQGKDVNALAEQEERKAALRKLSDREIQLLGVKP